MIHAASRRALDSLQEEQRVRTAQTSADALIELAGELYSVADLLVATPRLRRALGDPATTPGSRANLLGSLVEGKIGALSLEIGQAAVRERWSSPWDLTDALEAAGDDALFAAAEKNGDLDRVEDELFRLERILEAEGRLSGLLDEYAVAADRRIELLDGLLANKVSSITAQLVNHAVASERKRSIILALDDLLESAAGRQNRSVARVVSAVPLSDAQRDRLANVLAAMYGRQIIVRTAIDTSIQGGLVVRIGNEVIDGSIAGWLEEVRTALAG
jgi:F-type H+-transporting ATPase subunit delta